jgi:mevalonate kinase
MKERIEYSKQNKSFAQKLNEHNKYCEKTIKQCDELFSLAEEAKKNGDTKESERLYEQVEELLDSTRNTTQEFDIKHAKELEFLSKLTPLKSSPKK